MKPVIALVTALALSGPAFADDRALFESACALAMDNFRVEQALIEYLGTLNSIGAIQAPDFAEGMEAYWGAMLNRLRETSDVCVREQVLSPERIDVLREK